MTSIITTDANLWLLYARFNEEAFLPPALSAAIDHKTRACRTLLSKSGWEKRRREEGGREGGRVVEALEGLVVSHLQQPSIAGLAQLEMFLKGPLRRLQGVEEDEAEEGKEERTMVGEEKRRVEECLVKVRAKWAELKERQHGKERFE